jgi:hypothetical protein
MWWEVMPRMNFSLPGWKQLNSLLIILTVTALLAIIIA